MVGVQNLKAYILAEFFSNSSLVSVILYIPNRKWYFSCCWKGNYPTDFNLISLRRQLGTHYQLTRKISFVCKYYLPTVFNRLGFRSFINILKWERNFFVCRFTSYNFFLYFQTCGEIKEYLRFSIFVLKNLVNW